MTTSSDITTIKPGLFSFHQLMLIFAIAVALCVASQTATTWQMQVNFLDTVFGANAMHQQIAGAAQDLLNMLAVFALPVAIASLAALVAAVLTRNVHRPPSLDS